MVISAVAKDGIECMIDNSNHNPLTPVATEFRLIIAVVDFIALLSVHTSNTF